MLINISKEKMYNLKYTTEPTTCPKCGCFFDAQHSNRCPRCGNYCS